MKEQALILTCERRTEEVFALLKKDPSLAKHVFPWGNTLLRAAVLAGQKELVRGLLKREADPDVHDRHERTPSTTPPRSSSRWLLGRAVPRAAWRSSWPW